MSIFRSPELSPPLLAAARDLPPSIHVAFTPLPSLNCPQLTIMLAEWLKAMPSITRLFQAQWALFHLPYHSFDRKDWRREDFKKQNLCDWVIFYQISCHTFPSIYPSFPARVILFVSINTPVRASSWTQINLCSCTLAPASPRYCQQQQKVNSCKWNHSPPLIPCSLIPSTHEGGRRTQVKSQCPRVPKSNLHILYLWPMVPQEDMMTMSKAFVLPVSMQAH